MLKGINCFQLRFRKFITVYTFCRLALGDGTLTPESYSQKSTTSNSRIMTRQSATEVELGEEL
jgi:hypothetical protein